MPINFINFRRPAADWPKRKKAWIQHYMGKGCHREKATECAEVKRFKSSWP